MRVNFWRLLGADHLPKESRRKLGVVSFLYFIQGSPAAILWEVLPVYFRIQGVSLRDIGGLRFLELPYSLKFFWSPLVQCYGDRRFWITACMLVVGGVIAVLPFVAVTHLGWIAFLVLGLTLFSATQDIAIDSYTVGLTSPAEQGAVNGVRASAYRLALVLVGGGMVFLAAVLSWVPLYLAAAVILSGLGLMAP